MEWCDECQKETRRYPRGGCRSCQAREAGRASNAKLTTEERHARMARVRGAVTPEQLCANLAKGTAAWMAASTPEQRRERALLASRSRTPEETAEYTRRASYQAGRAHLARSIERKRELLAALEAEIKELAL